MTSVFALGLKLKFGLADWSSSLFSRLLEVVCLGKLVTILAPSKRALTFKNKVISVFFTASGLTQVYCMLGPNPLYCKFSKDFLRDPVIRQKDQKPFLGFMTSYDMTHIK